ncbi:zona pellucida sperm-binding protein 3-like [Chanos chanos]|uniref:Zona pellucida sperm-binding protein 3-like n=1 Tax=Chanos chanos TaxID=29144 RepID=A0A6J2VE22_CHACN|nr:zona pellucida sperm-binding protein 3-like [Chanos chanos]
MAYFLPAVTVDCGTNSISLKWAETQSLIDPSLLRLGDCSPSSFSAKPGGGGEALFHAEFNDCNFMRLVTGDELVYMNNLTTEGDFVFSHLVVCAYEKPSDWGPPRFDPVFFHTYGQGELIFHMGLMKDDFSGPSPSTTFSLGSVIPIEASVAQQGHQPLLLLMEECVASITPELGPESHLYPIITNKGCLTDSKKTNSRFLPRKRVSELRLYLQAFKFVLGEEIYIHCTLLAWDPNDLDNSKKACHYDKTNGGWELLDDPSQSALCTCCDTNCRSRNRRDIDSDSQGLSQRTVLGPLTVVAE